MSLQAVRSKRSCHYSARTRTNNPLAASKFSSDATAADPQHIPDLEVKLKK